MCSIGRPKGEGVLGIFYKEWATDSGLKREREREKYTERATVGIFVAWGHDYAFREAQFFGKAIMKRK